ncbi:MAG: 50S ribosomal protein L25/general stress protein Ctc [Hyphomicrobium zavarzinii]|jgi:large subunit ribosomal protein L25|uniref:50S ribosomal protein L25/general stress protein Ctc n=1 Tax=Hyphomicrobium TaxID=81 RepID=UPI000382425C|nr:MULTISPECIES: 50S ribosomal protein L25/general stress protein Ctc [Hyphomicrobium]MBL8847647.1 50S ribosomal protein L25/general stress protein Ctc [Hyphomicrobium zavarzinii]WBT38175.1 50S ribosomal protein L25/general stress protein Ctc [Hyphomicrobium sp. DMF-1]HML45100.1 50S ribosomal protein L25/general stress protein Ctc [Hyphomicrobium zavarzinii]
MSEIVEIKATARPRAGKGAARQARREGNVPAVIYGDGQPAEIIAINGNDLWKQFIKGHFTSSVFDIAVGSNKIRVIPRDVQVDPVKDHPIHVDFLRIGKDGIIRVFVPIRFANHALSPGLKRGGVLNIVRHEVEIFCPYDKIPSFFEINLEGLEIGRSIHISAVGMPEGVSPVISNRDFTVATIAGAKKDDDEGAASAAEGAAPAAGDAKAAAPAAAKAGAAAAKGAAAPAAGGKAPAAKPAAKK